MQTIWGQALPILRERVGDRNFATWIEPMRDSVEDGDGIRLEVPTRFFQEWVARHFLATIRETLARLSGRQVQVRIVVNPEACVQPSPKGPLPASASRPPSRPRKPSLGQLVPWYTFETFVVGESNQIAQRAAQTVVREPGRRFNPFFLHGGVGLGKTHLINALGSEFLARFSRPRIACLSAESFMNHMITSIRRDQMPAFRDRYRLLDLLILDDVHFLAGKERTQEELFHTFNALQAEGKQIVLTCDKAPMEIAGLEERLRSRFEGGLTAEVHPPTMPMRLEILARKAAAQGTELPPPVARYVAEHAGGSVRELEGALTRVLATASIEGGPITLAAAARAFPRGSVPSPSVTLDRVIETVARELGVTTADLESASRSRTLAYPRQVAMYLCRALASASYASIGRRFGGRDHSTVMHAVGLVERRREADPASASLLARLEEDLWAGAAGAEPKPGEKRKALRGS